METFDLTRETPLSLTDAAELLPRKPSGKKLSIRTIERWIRHGHKGVPLEGNPIGNALVTSRESLQRFSERLAGANGKRPKINRRSHEIAKRKLEKAGLRKR